MSTEGGDKDPMGLGANEAGAKLDSGKPTISMALGYFFKPLALVNEVSLYGAKKYSVGGWVHVDDAENRYREALLRHVSAACGGEVRDPETGLFHAAHAAWNGLAWLYFVAKNSAYSEENQGKSMT